MLVSALVGDKFTSGDLVKLNCKTMWIKLADGHIIKRHRRKHMTVLLPQTVTTAREIIPIGGILNAPV